MPSGYLYPTVESARPEMEPIIRRKVVSHAAIFGDHGSGSEPGSRPEMGSRGNPYSEDDAGQLWRYLHAYLKAWSVIVGK